MIAKKISNWLIKQGAIEEEESKLYEYAVKTLIYLVSPFFIALFVGSLFGKIQEAIIMIVPYLLLRIFAGGFHMKTLKGCLMVSVTLFAAVFSIGLFELRIVTCGILIVFCTISIIIFSPIESSQKRLCKNKKKQYKQTASILAGSVAATIIVMLCCGCKYYAQYVLLGMFLVTILQWLNVIQKMRKKFSITTD